MSRPQGRHSSRQGQPSAEDTGSMASHDLLARQLSDMARGLQHETSTDATLQRMVQTAVAMVPGADEGSISVVTHRRHVSSHVPTGDLPARVDALQNEVGEGPCMDAAYEHQTVRVNNLAAADRWPRFARRAAEAGAASMLSFQLYVEGSNLGALNLYSRQVDAFDDESEHVGLLFASHAAIAFADAQKQDQLAEALKSRDRIGQAKGIPMERFKISGEQAFLLLAQASQNTNRRLHEVADDLIHSGELAGHGDH